MFIGNNEKEIDTEGRIPKVRKRLRELLTEYPNESFEYDIKTGKYVESPIVKDTRLSKRAEFIDKVRNRKAQIPSEIRSDKALERARSLYQ